MYFSLDWYNQNIASIPDRIRRRDNAVIFLTSASDYLFKECSHIAEEIYRESIAENDVTMQAFGKLYLSFYERMRGKFSEASTGFTEAEKLIKKGGQGLAAGIVYQMLAFEYWSSGNREKAFELAYEGSKLVDANNIEGIGWGQFQMGVFHFDLKDYEASLKYFHESEKNATTLGLNYQLARTRSGIGGVYIATGRLEEGIKYTMMALEGYRECGHLNAISRALNDLGVINFRMNNLAEAEKNLREALKIREDLLYAPGIITSRMELAKVLTAKKELEETESLLLSALQLSNETKVKQKEAQCHLLLSELYKLQEKPWQALEHLEEHFKIKSQVAGEESNNRLNSLQQKFATEKSEAEAEIHRLKNVELKEAYNEIEEKNKSILDSIHYAKRIQAAILPSDGLLESNLGEYFVLYKPKDIVSGDFYWAHEGEELFFLATCDCTGHGVPGAFMSLLNSTFLNEAVTEKNLADPAEIFNTVRKQLIAALNPVGSKEETRDGMDAALITIDKKKSTLHFASANSPVLLIRNGEIISFAADKFPVGIYPGYENKPFSKNKIDLQKGDCIYLLTDGFGDQFGGPGGKKFKLRRLKETLLEIHRLPMKAQQEKLDEIHTNWKGMLEQVDDILIAGIRF
jgi:serine phosphatase RsbU (regulator of sigma subunit)